MPVHADFDKIRANMLDFYGEKEGESVYHAWLKKCGYDDSKQMEGQACKAMEETAIVVAEKFEWTMPFKYYDAGTGVIIRGEALHPGITINKNLYTKDDLLKGARSLIGSRLEFLNHGQFLEEGNDVLDAEFVEPDRVEYVARVMNAKAVQAVRNREITHVSPSIICRKAIKLNGGVKVCEGSIFNGLCLVHRDDPAGPGDVRTSVTVWEKCPDQLEPRQSGPETDSKVGLKMSEKTTSTGQQTSTPPPPPTTPATVQEQVQAPVTGHGPVAGVPEPSIEDRVKTLEEQTKVDRDIFSRDLNDLRARLDTIVQMLQALPAMEKAKPAATPTPAQMTEKEWDAAFINDLPDSAFAIIGAGGEKDDQGKTVPRTLRHLPHHNAEGGLDLPHLRNALARMNQIEGASKTEAKQHLCAHAKDSEIVSEFCGEEPPSQTQEKTPPAKMQEKASPPPTGQGITKPVGELPPSQPGMVPVTELKKVFDDQRLFTPQLRERAILRLIGEDDKA